MTYVSLLKKKGGGGKELIPDPPTPQSIDRGPY